MFYQEENNIFYEEKIKPINKRKDKKKYITKKVAEEIGDLTELSYEFCKKTKNK